MKAIQLVGQGSIRVTDVDEPKPSPGEVVIRVGAGLICGTDLRMWKNGSKNLPLTLGHEIAGTISTVGEDVSAFPVGMRVALAPNFGCGVCDSCVAGQTHLCDSPAAIGVTTHGGFAEYLRIPAKAVTQGNLCPIGANVSFAEAAMAEPLSCVYHAFERSHVGPGDTVVIIGAGPIGLMHAKMYLMAGAGPVIVSDVNEQRLFDCSREEAALVTVPAKDLKQRVGELTNGRGADVVITAASVAAVQQTALSLVAYNARVIFFGGLPSGQEVVPLDTNVIHYKMITITGTSRQNLRQYRACLSLIDKGLVRVGGILTGTYGLGEAEAAFDSAARGVGMKSGFVLA